jgi:hypothetical protein
MTTQGPIDALPSRFLDPHLSTRPASPLGIVVREIAASVEHRLAGGFTKSPRRDAAARRFAVISNIIANLACLVRAPGYEEGGCLAIATAKTKPNRYDRSGLTRSLFAEMVTAMETNGNVIRHPYVFKEKLTTIEPTVRLLAVLLGSTVSLSDVTRDDCGETVWLSARLAQDGRYGEPAPKERIDYDDDEDSVSFRREMERINIFLNSADLAFDGQPQAPVALRRVFLLRNLHDPVAFSLNGRLAGGWWLQLPASERHRIRLEGEPLADLDFRGMFVQLAYRSNDWQLRDDFDPYAIPGLEHHREGRSTPCFPSSVGNAPCAACRRTSRSNCPMGGMQNAWSGRSRNCIRKSHTCSARTSRST